MGEALPALLFFCSCRSRGKNRYRGGRSRGRRAGVRWARGGMLPCVPSSLRRCRVYRTVHNLQGLLAASAAAMTRMTLPRGAHATPTEAGADGHNLKTDGQGNLNQRTSHGQLKGNLNLNSGPSPGLGRAQ